MEEFWNQPVSAFLSSPPPSTQETERAGQGTEENAAGAAVDGGHPSPKPPGSKFHRLAAACPEATDTEVRRFLSDHGTVTASSRKLEAYLRWNVANEDARREATTAQPDLSPEEVGSEPGRASDSDTWSFCCVAAGRRLSETLPSGDPLRLPQLAIFVGARDGGGAISGEGKGGIVDQEGNAVLHLLPAMLDTDLASPSAYALATAMYCDAALDRSDARRVTLVVDVRPGKGWANPAPTKVVPYLQKLSKIGSNMFPGRLARAVAVPVPAVCVGLWNMFRPLLDKRHAARVCLVGGPAGYKSPLPPEDMTEYFPMETIEALEDCRRANFLG